MKRSYYNLECDRCATETTIVVDNSNEEPVYCPICGNEAYATLEDEDEE